jgi:hypothetical protein
MRYTSTNRRGILLLMVLGLLAMFGMVAVAFVVLSSQTMKSAKGQLRKQQTYFPPANDTNEALMQLLRGTVNPISKMGSHSLLEDIYGTSTLVGQFVQEPTSSAPLRYGPVAGGQIVEVFTNIAPAVMERYIGSVLTITTSTNPSIRGLSTRIIGVNPRYGLFWFDPGTGNPEAPAVHSYVQILAFPNGVIPPYGTSFTINGMPFSGTGAGYNPLTRMLDLHYAYNADPAVQRFQLTDDATSGPFMPDYPAALLPFLPVSTYSSALTNPPSLRYPNGIPFPQVNNDYDAVDHHNMFLATPRILDATSGVDRILPSMHRPALVNYWYQQLFNDYVLGNIANDENKWRIILHPVEVYNNNPAIIISPAAPQLPRWQTPPTREQIVAYILELKRNIIGRPLTDDHPNFNGSNPTSLASYYYPAGSQKYSWECGDIFAGTDPATGIAYTPNNQPHWDVDTDGDGFPDANWIDIGLPIRSTADGRKYKALVAYYCLDMDGRLNLNAHGTQAQANQTAGVLYDPSANPVNSGRNYRFAGSMNGLVRQLPIADPLLRGQGYGPAEINLSAIFTATPVEFQNLLIGNGNLEGRYGCVNTSAGAPAIAVPGIFGENYLGCNKLFNLPNDYSLFAGMGVTVGYGNPVDLKGTMAIGLDPRGQPLYQDSTVPYATSGQTALLLDPGVPNSQTNPYIGEKTTNPYALNLSLNVLHGIVGSSSGQNDNPFSVAELERILRPYDRDSSSLPARITTLAPTLAQSPQLRHSVTTESHDVPTQPMPKIPNSWFTGGFRPHADFTDNTGTVTPDEKAMIKLWYPPRSVADLLKAKYYHDARNGGASVADSLTAANNALATHATKLFPRELLAGLKMNLNRTLENWEGTAFQLYTNPGTATSIPFSYSVDGQPPLTYPMNGLTYTLPDNTTPITNGTPVSADQIPLSQQAKQLHARHLYVLMMLLRETGNVQFFTEPSVLSDATRMQKLTARRIAQWAINAVDFMTPDSVMTPFEYDEDPFTIAGWQVDGRIGTPAYPSPDDTQPYRGLVWGCKSPDLLMTENVNFHDKRLADTNMDPSNKMRQDSEDLPSPHPADDSLDQPKIPQGSTFVELQCVRNDTNPQAPSDLYINVGGRWYLDLAKMAPAWSDAAWTPIYAQRIDHAGTVPSNLRRAYPVWRMVISENHIDNPNNNVYARLYSPSHPEYHPDIFTPQTEQTHTPQSIIPTSLLATPTQPTITIDRIVWFTSVQPVTITTDATNYHADAERVYYYRQGVNRLRGGEYLIVGPRPITHIGSLMVQNPRAVSAGDSWGMPSPQTVNLNTVGFVNYQGNSMYPNTLASADPQIKTPNAMIVAADPPTTWGDSAHIPPLGIGLNISEPIPNVGTNYYPEPTDSSGGDIDWYGDPVDPGTRTFRKPLDKDPIAHRPLELLTASGTIGTATTAPLYGGGYKTFLLQRLANPSAPFEPTINPYITVDWMPADLTVFNGMDYMSKGEWDAIVSAKHFASTESWDPNDPTLDNTTIRHFASRQRGDGNTATILNNIWAQISPASNLPPRSTIGVPLRNTNNVVFQCNLNHTLGYLNLAYWDRTSLTNRLQLAGVADWTTWDGEAGVPLYRDIANPTQPNFDPNTQPWITRYTPDPDGGTPPAIYYGDPIAPYPWFTWNNRPYNSPTELLLVPSSDPGRMLLPLENWLTTAVNPYFAANPNDMPFASRLNFFSSVTGAGPAPSLHRIFDFIQVPSPFVGAETQGNPINLAAGNHNFYPPFNHISNYREPGKINLNTIYSQDVFNGLMNYFPGNWGQFVQSRRGYDADITGNMLITDPAVPSEFARPFRSTSSYDLTPPALNGGAYDRDISPTLLRSIPAGNPHLTDATNPLFNFTSANVAKDATRNPYFKYLGLERLANLTTTRSNVYSVWITVGYFEVTPAAPKNWMINMPGMTPPQLQQLMQQIYPDGYELGQELGSDTGEIVRHRSFYMIDRSIPVGFQRGQDLNVEKAILLKRFIE